jgi:hypothetical protein
VICFHQVRFGEDGATRKVVGKLLCVFNGVLVRDSVCVQGLLISTWPPTAALLGQDMEGWWPWSLVSTLCCAVSQHDIKLILKHHQVVRSKVA